MKVKLLRKVRARFLVEYDKGPNICDGCRVYDLKKKKDCNFSSYFNMRSYRSDAIHAAAKHMARKLGYVGLINQNLRKYQTNIFIRNVRRIKAKDTAS